MWKGVSESVASTLGGSEDEGCWCPFGDSSEIRFRLFMRTLGLGGFYVHCLGRLLVGLRTGHGGLRLGGVVGL
jgi:hypothetical protein